ncbi:putative inorganic phosphate cotransporter, partial [Trichinella sp. T8]
LTEGKNCFVGIKKLLLLLLLKNYTTMEQKVPFWRSVRLSIILLTAGGMFVFTLMRGLIGFAMVCMVNSTAIGGAQPRQYYNASGAVCDEQVVQIKDEYDGQFPWLPHQQGIVFAALSWGEILTDLPAGYLSTRYSPKKMFAVGAVLAAAATAAIPSVANYGYGAVAVMRIVVGMAFAVLWPVKSSIVSRWTPASERSTALSIATSTNQLSVVVAMLSSSWLCKQKWLFGGWPAIFYLTSIVTLGWAVCWTFWVTDSPNKHRFISKAEIDYIDKDRQLICKLPGKIQFLIKQRSVWAIVVCQGSATWGMFSLLFYLPQYLRDVMRVDLKKNGLYSALPFLAQFLGRLMVGYIADSIVQRTKLSRTAVMKLFNSIGFFSLGALLFASGFLTCERTGWAIGLITIGTALWASVVAGFVSSTVLVAPSLAGIISSWAKFYGTFIGLVLPHVVGAIVRTGAQHEWQIVFGIGLLQLYISGFVFIVCGSGEQLDLSELLRNKRQLLAEKARNSDNTALCQLTANGETT